MYTRRALLLGAAGATLLAGQRSMADQPSSGLHRLTHDAGEVRYVLSVPTPAATQERAPLILVLHYGGPVSPFYGAALVAELVEPAFRDLGAFIVAPDSAGSDWTSAENEERVLSLLAHLRSTLPVDRTRALVTGYSMGGIGSWHFAAKHPELFRAAIPIAGRPPQDAEATEWQVPLHAIQGGNDEIFPLSQTDSVITTLRERGYDVDLSVVEHATHYEVGAFREPLAALSSWVTRVWAADD